MKRARRIILALACLLVCLLAVRRAFTVVINLGTISHQSLYPRPNPGDVAMAKSLAAVVKQHSLARLFVIRWHGQSGDLEYLVEAQYDRPSGQLNIWSKGTSSWAPSEGWRLNSEYQRVTDDRITAVANAGGSIRDLLQHGATRVPLQRGK